ncbi:hypothetical protein FS749_004440 [Ceratobasidium sp. UAMH 11750]|nr:hypothetical protein FS749_004440 [Ceratobasidium sp. UAMH 11750]
MRLFLAFGVLGLLHVARGGELDSFAGVCARNIRDNITARNAPSVSSESYSSSLPDVELPPAFQGVNGRRKLHKRVIDWLDVDRDNHVDANRETMQHMLRTYGMPDIEEAINHHTLGAIRTNIESYRSQNVISCSAYLTSTEGFCNPGHKSLVETCIMAQPCGSIGSCMGAVGMAAEGTGAVEMLDQQGLAMRVDPFNVVGHAETGLEEHKTFRVHILGDCSVDILAGSPSDFFGLDSGFPGVSMARFGCLGWIWPATSV